MFRKRYPKGQNPYVLIFGVIVILSMMFTIFSQKSQDKLAVYTESDKVETKDTTDDSANELDVDTEIYTDNEHHFSLSIPTDWEQVTKDGYTTFVHSASASSLQIQVLDYDPLINNYTQESLSSAVVEEGKTFVSYTQKTTSSYELMYQDYQNNTYDYIEEVYWDRDQIIKLKCVFNDANYEKIIPYYELILNSFAWKKTSEIPEDYAVYYNDTAQFEVLVPVSWTIGSSSNTIVATDGTTGATQTITALNSTTTFENVSATDISKLLNTGQSGFMMSSYDNSTEPAIARCSYIVNNVQYQEVAYGYSTGESLFFILFDYESGTIDEDLISLCGSSFRSFATTDIQDTEKDTTADQDAESSNTTPEDAAATENAAENTESKENTATESVETTGEDANSSTTDTTNTGN